MTENTQIVTVLTGDLVNSTALGAEKVEMAFERLQEVAKDLEAWHGGSLLFTRHRGDGWQVVLREPKYAFRSVLAFRAGLKALGTDFETYIGMSTGKTELTNDGNLNDYTGNVFNMSGRALESAKRKGTLATKFVSWESNESSALAALADYMTSTWTATQSSVVYEMLLDTEGPTYSKAALKLGKSRQAITKSLDGAGYSYLFRALFYLEEAI